MPIGTRKPKLRGSDFTQHGSMTIHCKGHERANVEKVIQSAVLVRLEDGRQAAALCVQLYLEVCSHRLAVHHEMVQIKPRGIKASV